MRLFGDLTKEDVENEAKVVSEVCRGHCNYVIEVLEHGWLEKTHSYYFIDMEYCNWTLEDYIQGLERNPLGQEHIPDNGGSSIITARTEAHSIRPENQPVALAAIDNFEEVESKRLKPFSDDEIDWEGMGVVLDDILTGLIYIHGQQIVHRDLKPRNGIHWKPYSTPLKTGR